jgi:hypothetical protein
MALPPCLALLLTLPLAACGGAASGSLTREEFFHILGQAKVIASQADAASASEARRARLIWMPSFPADADPFALMDAANASGSAAKALGAWRLEADGGAVLLDAHWDERCAQLGCSNVCWAAVEADPGDTFRVEYACGGTCTVCNTPHAESGGSLQVQRRGSAWEVTQTGFWVIDS